MASGSVNPRAALATLVLMGILLLTVGGAWLLVRFYRSPSRQGAILLQEMRRRTLVDLWPREPYTARFERRDATGRLQSRLRISRRPANDGFTGASLHEAVSGAARRIGDVRETWAVSRDLSKGTYRAEYLSQGLIVRIDLGREEVEFRATGLGPAQAEAPANYIPEGLEWLAVRLVARSGRKATFMTLLNEECLSAKDLVFSHLTLTPVDAQTVRGRYEGGEAPYSQTYFLDAAGEVNRMDGTDGSVLALVPGGPEKPETPGPEATEEPGVLAHSGR